jgi:hypothetical protein
MKFVYIEIGITLDFIYLIYLGDFKLKKIVDSLVLPI